MLRSYTPRHRLALRVFIGVCAVVVLLATACGADGSAGGAAPTGARPAGVSVPGPVPVPVPVLTGSESMR